MVRGDHSFPRSLRLRKRRQFLAMSREGARIATPHFVILWRPLAGPRSRLGITVTKRVSGAVGRNRVKRMVREAFRTSALSSRTPVDLVVIARSGAPALSSAEVARQLESALSRMQGAGKP